MALTCGEGFEAIGLECEVSRKEPRNIPERETDREKKSPASDQSGGCFQACPANTYKPSLANISCTACPSGAVTVANVTLSNSIDACRCPWVCARRLPSLTALPFSAEVPACILLPRLSIERFSDQSSRRAFDPRGNRAPTFHKAAMLRCRLCSTPGQPEAKATSQSTGAAASGVKLPSKRRQSS